MATETMPRADAAVPAPTTEQTPPQPQLEAKEPEVDWKAKYEADKAEWERKANDARSVEVNLLKQEQRDLTLQRIEDRLAIIADLELTKEEKTSRLQAVDQKYAKQEQEAGFTEEMAGTVDYAQQWADRLGMSLSDIDKHPAFKNAVLYLNKARQTGQVRWLDKAKTEVAEAAHKVRDQRERDAETARRKAETEAKKKARDEGGEFDLSTGPSGAGGEESLATLSKKDTRRMTQKELADHERKLDAALRRGR